MKGRNKRFHAVSLALAISVLIMSGGVAPRAQSPVPVRAVLVNYWQPGAPEDHLPGERNLWFEQGVFSEELPFPLADRDLGYDPARRILLLTTGPGDLKAATAVMALGLDPRFDLSRAYFVLNGIAGGDPRHVSLGSVVISRYVIDGDLAYYIDPREAPWCFGSGFIPLFGGRPFEYPPPDNGELFRLDASLADFAFRAAAGTVLEESPELVKKRALYRDYPAALEKPRIRQGENISANRFWHGRLATVWARHWMQYFTEGDGIFMASGMEDAGVLRALQRLGAAGLVDSSRVVVMRSISNFTMQWRGASAYQSLMSEGNDEYTAVVPAVRNLFAAVRAVLDGILHLPEDPVPATAGPVR